MTDQLRAAAQAVLDRWDSPKWEWATQGPTADLMAELRAALAQQAELEQLRAENARLAREAHTWWTALAGATAEIEQWRRSAGCVRAEPVGTVRVDAGEVHIIPAIRDADRSALKDGQAVYAAPPQRKPLTVEEILEMAEKAWKPSVYHDAEALLGTDGLVALVRAVEVKHNIKERP